VTGTANGLFEVAQIDTLRVFVNVPQAYAPNVKAGLPVRVTVRGQLMQPVTGRVTRTVVALDPGTRTLLTQVDIPNPSHRMLPGTFVYVDIKIGPSGTRWRVPRHGDDLQRARHSGGDRGGGKQATLPRRGGRP
jgi:membrane fusion protein, multidrug efflux system